MLSRAQFLSALPTAGTTLAMISFVANIVLQVVLCSNNHHVRLGYSGYNHQVSERMSGRRVKQVRKQLRKYNRQAIEKTFDALSALTLSERIKFAVSIVFRIGFMKRDGR